jgi:hypothetical protein
LRTLTALACPVRRLSSVLGEVLERMWRRLMSPEARRFRQAVDERVHAQREMITATQRWARKARSDGEVEHAIRIEREGRTLEERLQHGDLLVVRRMLSALKPR